MRRNFRYLLFTLSSIVLFLTGTKDANAYDIVVENADGINVYYNFINNETELEVTSYERMKRTERVGNFIIDYKYYNRDGIEKEVTEESTRPPYIGNVTIPEYVTVKDRVLKVKSIGRGAFIDCPNLSVVSIPNSVTHIGTGAFSFSGLTYIKIPKSVISIDSNAFADCWQLSTITIGKGVKSIGKAAFNCENLSTIMSLIKNPSAIGGEESISWPFHSNAAQKAVLLVPFGTKGKYKKNEGWKDFLNIKESK